ncbi:MULTISPECIES: PKD domain-containing protein [Spirosoma]|uniref:PKD domain-containing protein n=1 Tax=Spirosoma sordidisoli TaxID=2502893 RepID=A0A4Q2UFM2_9BACT|nr:MULTISPECIES: PKD domain-containing protein [Spirosoma]RYC68113.1 PKD domain-containing protein [Spirosoma sordidisoli]
MLKRFLFGFVLLGLAACEPFDLERKTFPVCAQPSAEIGVVVDQLDVTFFLDKPTGDITVAGWDPGDGRNIGRVGNRVTYNYAQPGTYTVTLVLVNSCDDKYVRTAQITVRN